MKFKLIKTVKNTDMLLKVCGTLSATTDYETENNLLCIFPDMKYQEISGFGAAFTEAAALTFYKLSKENQDRLIDAYFNCETGICYNFCRTHINSCDFSLENYTYVEENDDTLSSFNIERDKKAIIPMIKEAQKRNDITFLASPWSPPPYMKTNNQMNCGGSLKKEYLDLWSDYFVKYIESFRKEGIDIKSVTIQNEPKATQTWDSCIYTATEEAEFAAKHLGKKMKDLGVEVFFWDHNKERLLERSQEMFSFKENHDYVSGAAFHWYSGDHFEQLSMFHELYPDKKLILSEACQEYSLGKVDSWYIGERYAHDMFGNFNNYCNAFCDWNILLDEKGGPNHVGNFCDAPIMADTQKDTLLFHSSYYYIGHFSRYIKQGARRLGISRYSPNIEAAAFENPDNKIVIIVMNSTDSNSEISIMINKHSIPLELEPHSIATLIEA